MPLIQATLAAGLANMTPTDQESVAVEKLASAYVDFMSTAQAGPVPIVPLSLQSLPKAAFIAAATGLSNSGQGAQKIADAVNAFWAAMVPLASTLFPTATVLTPPPSISTLSALLPPIFLANTQGNLDLTAAANTIAAAIYGVSQGGQAIIALPPPTAFPIV